MSQHEGIFDLWSSTLLLTSYLVVCLLFSVFCNCMLLETKTNKMWNYYSLVQCVGVKWFDFIQTAFVSCRWRSDCLWIDNRAGYHQVLHDTILSQNVDSDNITIQQFCDNRYIANNFIHDALWYVSLKKFWIYWLHWIHLTGITKHCQSISAK